MELIKFDDYCIRLKNINNVVKASKFSDPLVIVGFECNRRDVEYCVIQKTFGDGGEARFSGMSFVESEKNPCYLFYKNKHLKQHMIENIVDMFASGVIFLRILVKLGKNKEILDDTLQFIPLFARYKMKKVSIKGERTGIIRKKERLCFDSYVDASELYLDSHLLDNVGRGNGENKGVKMHITKDVSARLLSGGGDEDNDSDEDGCIT